MISVVIPTVEGREKSLDRCVKAYEKTYDDIEILVYPNTGHPCGEAWIKGGQDAKGDYIHITSDDAVPHKGWAEAAMECVDRGDIPAATVWGIPGGMFNTICHLLPRMADVPNVLMPFLSREQFELGDWLLPIHYGTDDWVTYVARMRGMNVMRLDAYAFDHYAESAERQESRPIDVPNLATAMAKWGYVPLVYLQVAMSFGWSGWIQGDPGDLEHVVVNA